MKPAEEDALVAKIYGEYANGDKVYIEDAIRLAIRAAVAAERERAARDRRRAAGWDAAQSLLGHAVPGTTQRYIRARDGEDVDPVEFGTDAPANGTDR